MKNKGDQNRGDRRRWGGESGGESGGERKGAIAEGKGY